MHTFHIIMGSKPFTDLVPLGESEDFPPDIHFSTDYFRRTGKILIEIPVYYLPKVPEPFILSSAVAAAHEYIRTHPEEFP
jgi:hypothetical protein